MRALVIVLLGAAVTAGCDGGDPSRTATATANANANAAAPKPKRAAYCFFKDANTKAWAASAGAGGNVTVTGRAYIDDARYKPNLHTPEVEGAAARVQLSMTPNDTGFASADDWWDVTSVIPGSAGVASVTVLCGEKTVAALKVPGR